MLKLDLFTLDVVTIINLVATGAAMFLIWSLNKRVNGLRRSALGSILLGVGFGTIPLRLYLTGKAVILLPNLISFAGAIFISRWHRQIPGLSTENRLARGVVRRLHVLHVLLAVR